MDIGVSLPTTSREAWSPGLACVARMAEENGAASVWVNDHLAMTSKCRSTYPYSADGKMTWRVTDPQMEALASLAHVAAVTTTARLGTAVLVLTQRHPLEVAKTAATIDVLSGGRLTLGVGAGWLMEEMSALGYSFEDRASRLEECVHLLRACWTGRVDEFTGAHFTLSPRLVMEPRPSQTAGPGILIGGVSAPARRRAARIGDGWLAVANADSLDVEKLRAHLTEIHRIREALARRNRFTAVLKINGTRATDDQVIAAVFTARQAGFDEAVLEIPWVVPERVLWCLHRSMERIA